MDKTSHIPQPARSRLPVFNSRSPERNHVVQKQTLPKKNLRRSRSVGDLLTLRNPINRKPMVQPSASTIQLGKRPAPATKEAVKPAKVMKSSVQPQKENSKPAAKATKPKTGPPRIPPYDYKARYNAEVEKFSKFKENHTNCIGLRTENVSLKEQVEKLEDTLNEFGTLKEDFDELKNKHGVLEVHSRDVENNYSTLKQEHSTLKCKYNELVHEHTILEDTNCKNKEKIVELECVISDQKKAMQENEQHRRALHNLVQELKGNIRVFCRVRPPLPTETERMTLDIDYTADKLAIRTPKVSCLNSKSTALVQDFMYDAVFAPSTTQQEIFEELDMLVQSALDGYHVCVFAYGQTGSGKTFTMQGNPTERERGMIPRSVQSLFKRIEHLKLSGWKYEVQASFLEVYNETIKDLLNPLSKLSYDIKHNDGKGAIVTNLEIRTVQSEAELQKLIRLADQNRSVAVTNYNEHSSRSHALTKIYLYGTDDNNTISLSGSINLVDLAGSENAKLSTSETITETKHINKSLAALGNVMLALHNGNSHIPYRDSKLTYLLSSCLGGNSKTLMVLNIAPFQDCFTDSLNALRFAQKVKDVKTNFKKNKTVL